MDFMRMCILGIQLLDLLIECHETPLSISPRVEQTFWTGRFYPLPVLFSRHERVRGRRPSVRGLPFNASNWPPLAGAGGGFACARSPASLRRRSGARRSLRV